MNETLDTSIEELDSHMKDLKFVAIFLAAMFVITLGFLYLMTISDSGSAGHPAVGASEHGEVEADHSDDNANVEGDSTTEEDGETSFSIDGNVYQLVF